MKEISDIMRKRSRKSKRIENCVGGKFDSIVERYDATLLMENTKVLYRELPTHLQEQSSDEDVSGSWLGWQSEIRETH